MGQEERVANSWASDDQDGIIRQEVAPRGFPLSNAPKVVLRSTVPEKRPHVTQALAKPLHQKEEEYAAARARIFQSELGKGNSYGGRGRNGRESRVTGQSNPVFAAIRNKEADTQDPGYDHERRPRVNVVSMKTLRLREEEYAAARA